MRLEATSVPLSENEANRDKSGGERQRNLFITFFVYLDSTIFDDSYPVFYKLEEQCDFILLLTNFNRILDN